VFTTFRPLFAVDASAANLDARRGASVIFGKDSSLALPRRFCCGRTTPIAPGAAAVANATLRACERLIERCGISWDTSRQCSPYYLSSDLCFCELPNLPSLVWTNR